MTQTLTAMYDNRAEAEAAQAKLVAAGIPQSSIKLLAGTQTAQAGTSQGYDHTRDEVASGPRSRMPSCRKRTATPTARA